MVETDLTVVLVQAGSLMVGPPLAAWGAAALVVGRDLLAGMIAGDGAYSGFVISVDGGNCAASSADLKQIGVFRHQCAVFELLGNQVVSHLGGHAETTKMVQGLESLVSKAFIFRIRLVGFHVLQFWTF